MTITVGVTIYNGPESPVSKFDATFDADTWEILSRFARFEGELANAAFVRAGMPLDLSFSLSPQGIVSPPDLPADAVVREFLHLLRPLILQSEPTYYWKVQGILGRALAHERVRARLALLNGFFTGTVATDVVRVNVADLTINSEAALDLWLNAFEYHRDRSKELALTKATSVLPFEVAKGFFIDLLILKAEAIQGLAALVRDIQAAAERRRGWVG